MKKKKKTMQEMMKNAPNKTITITISSHFSCLIQFHSVIHNVPITHNQHCALLCQELVLST